MEKGEKWAFILDKDEFVRLSLNKILKKYGFQVKEIEDFSQLEIKKQIIKGGMILADVEVETLEKWLHILRKWNNRFILMSPLITNELTLHLKKMGIHYMIKKPVEPKILRRMIRLISFPNEVTLPSLGKKGEGSRLKQKGGEDT